MVLLATLLCMPARAETVSPERAGRVARGWTLAKSQTGKFRAPSGQNVSPKPLSSPGGDVIGYHVKLPDGGCVVVAADDRLYPILFSSQVSDFDPDAVPMAAVLWQGLSQRMQQSSTAGGGVRLEPDSAVRDSWQLFEGPASVEKLIVIAAGSGTTGSHKGPMIRARWGQFPPYGNNCPRTFDGQLCLVGCVATAAAQLANYWQTPVHGLGNSCYSWFNGRESIQLCADYGATVYDWRRMPEQASQPDQLGPSLLSYQCGVGIQMIYSPTYSGSIPQSIGPMLQEHFGFARDGVFVYRTLESDETWYQLFRQQIAAGFPVIYALGPHCAVADGYDDTTRQIHLNLGYNGADNGWYQLQAMPSGWSYGNGISLYMRPASFGGGPRKRFVAADGLSGQYATIRAAMSAATDGDEIVLQPGTYTGWGNRDLDFWGKAITVRSMNPADPQIVASTIIDCQGSTSEPHRAFLIHSGETRTSIVAGLTITGAVSGDPPYERELLPGMGAVGGAVLCVDSSPAIVNCVLRRNVSASDGGAIAVLGTSHPTLANCVLTGNHANDRGGGIFSDGAGVTLTQCAVAGNSASTGGGLFTLAAGSLEISGTIFWGNDDTGLAIEASQVMPVSGNPQVNYSLIQGWTNRWGGAGNLVESAAGPFVSAPGADNQWGTVDDNLRLRASSVCVDAAVTSLLPPDDADLDGDGNRSESLPLDLDGNLRTFGTSGKPDIGPYEHGSIRDCDHNGVVDSQQPDGDGDGIIDACDNCPQIANADQKNTDSDGLGDVCDLDDDNDGVPDQADNCPRIPNADQRDSDSDGVGDDCDNCPLMANTDQKDSDGNGTGDLCESRILFVNATASGGNTGRNWKDAFKKLDDALAKADGSGGATREIWVARGTYRPSATTVPGISNSASFQLVSGVAVYGGFVGSETTRNQRIADPARNGTVLSGDLQANDSPAPSRWDPSQQDNAQHVVDNGQVVGAVLDGFTVVAGCASGSGGGLIVRGGVVAVQQCRFITNKAGSGGAISVEAGKTLVSRCVFARNFADTNGGAVLTSGGETSIANSVFAGNQSGNGGAISALGGNTALRNCTLFGNRAVIEGQSIFMSAPLSAASCIFWSLDRGWESQQIRNFLTTSADIHDCCIQGWLGKLDGVNLLQAYPLLMDPVGPDGILGTDDDDYRLQSASPCIDVGDPGLPPPAGDTDIAGKPRLTHCRVDMGAHESSYVRDCDGNGVPDACDLKSGRGADCNANGVPDACEVVSAPSLVVSGAQRGRLQLFDGAGDFDHVLSIQAQGRTLLQPGAVVTDTNHNIYVANQADNSVWRFSHLTGALQLRYQDPALKDPSALLMLGTSLYVASAGNNSVLEFDVPTGTRVRTFVESGSGGLNGPSSLLPGIDGALLVASSKTNQILSYRLNSGQFLGVLAESGDLKDPSAMLSTSVGVLVASRGTDSILEYASDGTYLGPLVRPRGGGLSRPSHMLYGGAGLLVCSSGNNKIITYDARDGAPIDQNPTRRGVQPEFTRGAALHQPHHMAFIFSNDCDRNGVPDSCEIADGSSTDCNKNKFPDVCESDMDHDGLIDACDLDDDNDGILDDGDKSGINGDNPCKGGATVKCDDNCPGTFNPDQADADGDGVGDGCDRPILVDTRAAGRNDGTSWPDAFTDLQDALTAARQRGGSVEVWVAQGRYKPDDGTLDRASSFNLSSGVAVYGGFAGIEARRAQRRPLDRPTILSGDLKDDDAAAGGGRSDNSYHVVSATNVSSSSILDGFVIAGGVADGSAAHDDGGGLIVRSGGPTIVQCQFVENRAKDRGGAVFCGYYAHPILLNCSFTGNRASRGGAVATDLACNPSLTNCMFVGNTATVSGGGLDAARGCNLSMIHCTLSGNTAGKGGGLQVRESALTLMNSIVWGNRATQASGLAAQLSAISSNILVACTCIQDDRPGDGSVYPGAGNLDTDPKFVRSPNDGGDGWGIGGNDDWGDLRLQRGSPCIDVANSSVIPQDVTDLDGDGNRSELLPLDLDRYSRFFSTDTTHPDPPADLGSYENLPDCNSNGLPDLCESSCGAANSPCDRSGCGSKPDCNHNGIPDECEPANACQAIYGDLDFDGDVDQSDFAIFQKCISLKTGPNPSCATSDLDFDGDVDTLDAGMFFKCMTGADRPINPLCRP